MCTYVPDRFDCTGLVVDRNTLFALTPLAEASQYCILGYQMQEKNQGIVPNIDIFLLIWKLSSQRTRIRVHHYPDTQSRSFVA